MKTLLPSAALLLALAATTLAGDPPSGSDIIAQAQKARDAAPASVFKFTMVDPKTQKPMVIIQECVGQDLVHVRTMYDGKLVNDVVADGIHTVMTTGSNPPREARPLTPEEFAKLKDAGSLPQAFAGATDFKLAGHEVIAGVPASVYTFRAGGVGKPTVNRIWIADADHRPLKAEGQELDSNVPGATPRPGAASATVVISYDSSLKIVFPTE